MIRRWFVLSICLPVLGLGAAYGSDSEPVLFAAMAMTKEQEASSLPTDSGVFLYDRERATWERIGPVILFMNSIAADPSDPKRLFIACGNGIVRTTDGGRTWRMTTGWRESDLNKIAIDPSDGRNVYASSVWGVVVSRDGGDSWESANDGLPERYSRTILVDEQNPERVVVATAAGIYVSYDRARTWNPVASGPGEVVLDIERSRADPHLWIAGTEGKGVYISRDDGARWTSAVPGLDGANIYGVAAHPEDPSRFAAGGWDRGVWVSTDGGGSWADRREGLPSPHVTAVSYDPVDSGRLWASTFEEGTYYSDDDGRTWREGGLHGAYVFDLDYVIHAP